jgi:hypothetical protein
MKTLHLIARDFKGVFNVGFVRVNPDEHLLAATYSIDLLNSDQRPPLYLIQGGRAFLAQSDVKSYADIVEFCLYGY